MSTDFTSPLTPPRTIRKKKGEPGTRLVARNNERQLDLVWTEATNDEMSIGDAKPREYVHEPQEAVAKAEEGLENLQRRAYPRSYDPDGPAGAALALLNTAKAEAAKAVDEFNDGDLAGVGSRINLIAALMAKTYPHTEFNPAVGATVSFLRRATLLADALELGLSDLMGLAKATQTLADNPLLSIERAADLITELEEQGWMGADPNVAAFVTALLQADQLDSESLPITPVNGQPVKGDVS